MARSFTRNAIIIGTFSAASIIGGLLKIPSPVGSIALDSLPGYFAAAFYSSPLGGIIGAIGHLGSAATGGFPLGYLHVAVAITMFGNCLLFGWIARAVKKKYGLLIGGVVATLTNGIATPFSLVVVGLPLETAKVIWVFLLVASAINVWLAVTAVWLVANINIRS